MSGEIIEEVNVFAKAIMLGVICGVIYDLFRIGRRIYKKNIVFMGIQDIIYWCIVSVVMCIYLYKSNGGIIRGYIIFGIGMGMILYELSIGRFFVKYCTIVFLWINKKIKKISVKICKIIHLGLKKILKPFKIVGNTLNGKIRNGHRLEGSKKLLWYGGKNENKKKKGKSKKR